MSDYISRESAIKALRDLRKQFSIEEDENKAFNLGLFQGIIFASKEIKAIPAADVRKVMPGRWVFWNDSNPQFYSCDYCGAHSLFNSNFCPNCGADMSQTE